MTKQISPLRQRMIDDMAFLNMSPNTQKVYAYAVANFARFYRQSPDKLGLEGLRRAGRGCSAHRRIAADLIHPWFGSLEVSHFRCWHIAAPSRSGVMSAAGGRRHRGAGRQVRV
jgi:integrase-like protein